MNFLQILKTLVPLVVFGVQIAEKEYKNDPKSGSAKKQLVTDLTSAVLYTVNNSVTGGAKDTWNNLSLPISTLIDVSAGLLFPNTENKENK
jgi:hypothetical protein